MNDDTDEYLTEVNAFFQPELSRYAPHFNNGELRPAPMDELYGPGAEAARLHPTKYKEFIEKLTSEQAVSFRADSRHNHMLRWTKRVEYAHAVTAGWAQPWSDLTPIQRYEFYRAAHFIEHCLYVHGIGDHLRRLSRTEEAIGVTQSFKLIYAGMVWGSLKLPA